jgi:ketosteroid isomerase-like protein
MKKLLLIVPLVFLLCFAFSCQKAEEVAEEPVVDVAAEEAAIREALSAWIKASDEKDVDGLVSYLADDSGTYLNGEFQNKDYLHKFWTDTYAAGSSWTVYPLEKLVVSASGDLAFLILGAEFTQVVEGEPKTGNKFYSLQVWKKQPDGSWKIVAFK